MPILHFSGPQEHPDYLRNFFLLRSFLHFHQIEVKPGNLLPCIYWGNSLPTSTDKNTLSTPTPHFNPRDCGSLQALYIPARPIFSSDPYEHRIKACHSWLETNNTPHTAGTNSLPLNTVDFLTLHTSLSRPDPSLPQDTPPLKASYRDGQPLLQLPFDLLSCLADILYKTTDLLPENNNLALWARYTHSDQLLKLDQEPLVDNWIDQIAFWFFPLQVHKTTPQLWLTHDMDVLSKYPARTQIKKWALSPWGLVSQAQKTRRELKEILQLWRGKKDPFDQTASLVQTNGLYGAHFFFLAQAHDHLAYRYHLSEKSAQTALACLQGLAKNNGDITLSWHGVSWLKENLEQMKNELTNFQKHLNTFFPASHKNASTEFPNPNNLVMHRSHFLTSVPQKTFYLLNTLGVHIDSTLGYNDRPGFRCGTTRPFFWWDDFNQHALPLLEIPLIAAEFQFGDTRAFPEEAAWAHWENLTKRCYRSGSIWTQLQHNNTFFEPDYPGIKPWYQKLVNSCQEQNWPAFKPHQNYQALAQALLTPVSN